MKLYILFFNPNRRFINSQEIHFLGVFDKEETIEEICKSIKRTWKCEFNKDLDDGNFIIAEEVLNTYHEPPQISFCEV